MDAAQSVTEEVDLFAGMTFGQACEMLFAKCKSNAPMSEGFQNMIDYIASVYEAMGVEFSREEYWNSGTISGSHEVFPQNFGNEFNTIPDVLTKEFLEDLIERIGDLEAATQQYRRTHESVVNSRSRGNAANGIIDTRVLTRSVNTAPVFLMTATADDEDDFI